jgi:C_GCAxxG_C_C family probable redox protein
MTVERAVSCFEQGFSCTQAVLSTYGPELGLERELALKVAGAFGGGMARMGKTCGAVTGAFMVIGLQHGKTRADDEQSKEKAYSLAQEFVAEFESRNGSIVCNELLDCDISDPEQRKAVKEAGLFTTRCPRFVRDAAEIVEQILEK